MFNRFDEAVLLAVHNWGAHHAVIAKILAAFDSMISFRCSVIFLLFWFVWFRDGDEQRRGRMMAGLLALCVATVMSFLLQTVIKIHVRPILDSGLALGSQTPEAMAFWAANSHRNSFPSDTATVFFSLAAVVFMGNRRLGAVAFAWVLIVIGLSRVFLTYHYASDIVGGLILGCLVPLIASIPPLPRIARFIIASTRQREYILYPLMFAFFIEMATQFATAVHLVKFFHGFG